MSVSILMLEKFIFFALFPILAVSGKHIHMVDKWMLEDLILIKPLIPSDRRGSSSSRGPPTSLHRSL